MNIAGVCIDQMKLMTSGRDDPSHKDVNELVSKPEVVNKNVFITSHTQVKNDANYMTS